MVTGTALERGFRAGAPLALTPLVTDLPPMFFSALLLDRLGWRALTALGVVGGAIILVVGIRFLRRNWSHDDRRAGEASGGRGSSAGLAHVLLSGLSNPAPWVFWLVVASPLLLRAWSRGPGEGLLFVVLLFGTNVTTALGLAWAASRTRILLNPRWHQRTLQAVGTTLVLVGALILWQSAVGNFQTLIDRQESLRSAVEDGIPLG
jgi:threonine/homoserine/homoserine lactone efflux protein